nr:unnamed protein product [Digitaria exilis]
MEAEMLTTPSVACVDALRDDVLASILLRLPSTSVLRCRAVCRSWRCITTDRSFLAALTARRPTHILTYAEYAPRAVSATPLSGDDHHPTRLFYRTDRGTSRSMVPRSGDVLRSLDGLLVLRKRPGLFAICNPATRQLTHLPPLLPPEDRPLRFTAVACGFYSHAPSGEYRLLCHVEHKWVRYYSILSASGGGARRHGRRAPRLTHKSLTIHYSAPVLSRRGVLHWLVHPEAAYTGMMLAFDTASEEFRLMPRRPPERRRGDTSRKLVELDGELAMVVLRQQGASSPSSSSWSLAVWDLRGYGEAAEEVWTMRYRVELPPPTSLSVDTTDDIVEEWRWLLPVGDGTCMLIGQGWRRFKAILYDLEEKRIRGGKSSLPARNLSPLCLGRASCRMPSSTCLKAALKFPTSRV